MSEEIPLIVIYPADSILLTEGDIVYPNLMGSCRTSIARSLLFYVCCRTGIGGAGSGLIIVESKLSR